MKKKRRLTPKRIARARELRQSLTGPERKLWYKLRDRRLSGLKFRRQHPVGHFVVDFICIEEKLIIEVDGQTHDEFRFAYDRQRQQWLEQQGYRVLRVGNDDVLRHIDEVADAILKAAGFDLETGAKISRAEKK